MITYIRALFVENGTKKDIKKIKDLDYDEAYIKGECNDYLLEEIKSKTENVFFGKDKEKDEDSISDNNDIN